MLSLAVCLYLLAAASWAIDIRILWKEMYVLLPLQLTSPEPEDFNAALSNSNGAPLVAQAVLLRLIVSGPDLNIIWSMLNAIPKWFISDCISLWRAYAILGRPRWLLALSFTLIFLEAGTSSCPRSSPLNAYIFCRSIHFRYSSRCSNETSESARETGSPDRAT